MNLTKQQLLEAALALNGQEKPYLITVEGDHIITQVKWMYEDMFDPESVTEEMRDFTYIVKVTDSGKYEEVDKMERVSHSGGFRKSVFIGKQITFRKTVDFDGEEINTTGFFSENYKAPVRQLLKRAGYKKKMSKAAKIAIGVGAGVLVAAVIGIVILLSHFNSKKAISVADFQAAAEDYGYLVGEDAQTAEEYDYVEHICIARDEEDDYQIELFVLKNADYAERIYQNNVEMMDDGGTGFSSHVNSPNYNNYSATKGDRFLYAARLENTVLLVEADSAQKAEVEKFIKQIGY